TLTFNIQHSTFNIQLMVIFPKIDEKINIFWFRRDLRLVDNTELYYDLRSSLKLLPIFIFHNDILNKIEDKTDRRVDFISQAIEKIQNILISFNTSLVVMNGGPVECFKQLLLHYEINNVFANEDYEPYAIKRDSNIKDLLSDKGINFNLYKDQVIFSSKEILKKDNKPYTIFTPYSKLWLNKFKTNFIERNTSEKLLNNFINIGKLNLISLKELGFKKTDFIYTEPEIDEAVILNYHKTRDYPYRNGTTNLSPHLRFGTISIRKLVEAGLNLNQHWLNELIWREFFMQILANFPQVVTSSFKLKYERIKRRNNEEEFKRWCSGETGYPLVDAGMRQLNQTGMMHNRVRMLTASFLTKHLLIDWRWAEAYFANKLLDYELSSNNGNWQWAAGCGCDAAPYFRIFNPEQQAKRFDPQAIYIKRWVPEYLSPDYTKPLVEHKFAVQRAINAYKEGISESL
ncbi:MAG: deoxyribodipyrimidine photo-lyase, partial [Bacteroidales bacterium]|nr:deoxyribodipyrimidine photo-lyase [Bacteroidales bacterium]